MQDFEGRFVIDLELDSLASYVELNWKLRNLKMAVLTCLSKPVCYRIPFIFSYKFWQ
jgi:hypothetical protein